MSFGKQIQFYGEYETMNIPYLYSSSFLTFNASNNPSTTFNTANFSFNKNDLIIILSNNNANLPSVTNNNYISSSGGQNWNVIGATQTQSNYFSSIVFYTTFSGTWSGNLVISLTASGGSRYVGSLLLCFRGNAESTWNYNNLLVSNHSQLFSPINFTYSYYNSKNKSVNLLYSSVVSGTVNPTSYGFTQAGLASSYTVWVQNLYIQAFYNTIQYGGSFSYVNGYTTNYSSYHIDTSVSFYQI